ncbi:acyl-CoA carboxylase epsilon subunit [Nesterenkonia aerolata]|uniref:Acyl-CoA carboxylase epsilon subunit n=1 Tax=Nesterenkonia aerolata TaxID=3074079 RepID=A0ABU2DTQ6_9MICC|nr:acyl-CoA carboxylase epsilon subunit [Nesterenkonia sp. LY-0111]MDR8019887.1 acyl-CoA carboxylase epsilon subunit [Nesterenkonia sp. LY-0111]
MTEQTDRAEPADHAEQTEQAASADTAQDLDPQEDQVLDDETSTTLPLRGTELSDDELAALLAVIGRLAGSEAVKDRGQGTAGPTNRARYRRRRLGLHERHGADAWQFAAGVR